MSNLKRGDMPEIYPAVTNGMDSEEAVEGIKKIEGYLTTDALEIYLFRHSCWKENSNPGHSNYLFDLPEDFYSINPPERSHKEEWNHTIHRISECERSGIYRNVDRTDVMNELFDIQHKINRIRGHE